MAVYGTSARLRGIAFASLVFGIFGWAFFWWTPFGMVLSLAGFMLGVVGWLMAPVGASGRGLLIGGTFLSAAAVIFNLVIAMRGMEVVQFLPLR